MKLGELLSHVQPEDLLKFGLIPEFIGRLPVIATLHELTEEALIDILTKPKNSLVKQFQKLFEMDGVKLKFAKGALHAIARKALVRESGARGLRAIMEEAMLDIILRGTQQAGHQGSRDQRRGDQQRRGAAHRVSQGSRRRLTGCRCFSRITRTSRRASAGSWPPYRCATSSCSHTWCRSSSWGVRRASPRSTRRWPASKEIFLAAQKSAKTNDPTPEDIYAVGTVGTIVQLLGSPTAPSRCWWRAGSARGSKRYVDHADFFQVEIEDIQEAASTPTSRSRR